MIDIIFILLAFFNDVPIMAIAYDHTGLEKKPVRWNMHQVITVATAMGIVGVIGSFGMLLIAMDWLKLDVAHIQTYVFLKMAVRWALTVRSVTPRLSAIWRLEPPSATSKATSRSRSVSCSSGEGSMDAAGPLLLAIDAAALWVFTIEIALKLWVYRSRFFRDGWNLFDFAIVAIAWLPAQLSASRMARPRAP